MLHYQAARGPPAAQALFTCCNLSAALTRSTMCNSIRREYNEISLRGRDGRTSVSSTEGEELIYRENYTHTRIHTHTYTHTRKHTHIHVYMHTHTRAHHVQERDKKCRIIHLFAGSLPLSFLLTSIFSPSFASHILLAPLSSSPSSSLPLQQRRGDAGLFVKHLSDTEMIQNASHQAQKCMKRTFQQQPAALRGGAHTAALYAKC